MSFLDVLFAGPYNIAYVGGLSLGFALSTWMAHRRGWSMLPWLTLLAACVAGGVIGSRFLHFDGHLAQAGEKTILGGIAGGMLALLLVQWVLRSPERTSVVLAPSLLLGFAVGRVGCFLAGCCFGVPTTVPWAVVYAPGTHPYESQLASGVLSAGSATSLPVHPTQLYEAVLAALLAFVLWRAGDRLRSAGAPALATAAGYGAIRFMVDFLRASGSEQLHFGLKTVQWTVGLIALTVALALFWRERNARSDSPLAGLTALPDSRGRSCVLLAGLLLLAWQGGAFFTWLEQTALIAAALPALVLLLRRPLLGSPWRVAPVLAAGALVVLPMPRDTLRPRPPQSHFTLGVSGRMGEFRTWRDLSPEDDCGPSEERSHEYRVYGVSGAYTRMQTPTDGHSIRLRTFFGTNRVVRIDDVQSNLTSSVRGAALSGSMETHWLGISGGLIGGRTIDSDGLPRSRVGPVLGLRVGPLERLHGEVRFNEHEPSPFPDTPLLASLGYGFETRGQSMVRVGFWEHGPFISGRHVTRSGTEIEPFLGVGGGDGRQFGLTLRQRFGWRSEAN